MELAGWFAVPREENGEGEFAGFGGGRGGEVEDAGFVGGGFPERGEDGLASGTFRGGEADDAVSGGTDVFRKGGPGGGGGGEFLRERGTAGVGDEDGIGSDAEGGTVFIRLEGGEGAVDAGEGDFALGGEGEGDVRPALVVPEDLEALVFRVAEKGGSGAVSVGFLGDELSCRRWS